ncbi:MAG: prepilin-type N-terminal cleavage/methylation domain-containing protein [Candidatus Thiodiazotropha sp. (ex Lucinoma annulata)]|nr:prepilin-type N-terminal cleavage/methylation domain-containing protein [Candidatus Thiodiazotropha sp. (ex Lucinoma annulata)]
MSSHQNNSGFSLIELMVVVLIVGIIAAIAFPSYDGYIKRARRGDGTETLLAAAQSFEVYRARLATYPDDIALVNLNAESPEGYYGNLTILNPTAECPIVSCFVIQIEPQDAQTLDDIQGFRFSSTGVEQRLENSVWHTSWRE